MNAMKPTAKQLAYLRTLAARTATTFAYPATSAAASAEIRRLRALPSSSAGDARRERRDVQHALQERPDDATAIRAQDVRGYGSAARWAHPHRQGAPLMTPAGRIVELRRYRIPAGQRALQAQRIDGRVAITDVPVDHDDRVYLVERHVHCKAELQGLVGEYAAHSQDCGQPAAIAHRRIADELADVLVGAPV